MSTPIRVELDWPKHNAVRAGDELYFCLERDGQVFLVRSRCPHRGGPLHLGQLDRDRVQCPWHGNAVRVDRLCNRALPTVRHGSRIVAYLPGDQADQPAPSTELTFPTKGHP